MHVQILLLINVVAHVAYCQENDDESLEFLTNDDDLHLDFGTNNDDLYLEFGIKSDDEFSLNYKELLYMLTGDYPTCDDELKYSAMIPKIDDQDVTLKLTKHYQCHNYSFGDLDIPGHTNYSGILAGTYWYDSKNSSEREVTASLEYLSSMEFQYYSGYDGPTIESEIYSTSPDDIETPEIVQNYFLYETGKEKLFAKLKLDNGLKKDSRLFVKVLGPIIRDSNSKLRGVVWTMSCTVEDKECKTKDLSIEEDKMDDYVLNQLNFVRNNKNVDNVEENKEKYPKLIQELFEKENPSYAVAAYQCNSDEQCSDVVQATLKEIAKEEELTG